MIEQLHATELRLARESTPGSGSPTGGWLRPPTTAAACTRDMLTLMQRADVFRQLRDRKALAQAWQIRSSHEVGLEWALWLLKPHFTDRGAGLYTLDPEAEGPTYVLDTETQQGHRATFVGLKLVEVQLIFEEGRGVRMDCQWVALRRLVPTSALPAAELAPSGNLVPTVTCDAAATTGSWDPAPRATQRVTAHGAQLFFQRECQAADFGADMVPDSHTRAPWRLLGEIYMPETAGITDTAFSDDWRGKIALWLGAGAEHFEIDAAHGFVTDDDLKGYDFRVRRLVFEGRSDDMRGICKMKA